MPNLLPPVGAWLRRNGAPLALAAMALAVFGCPSTPPVSSNKPAAGPDLSLSQPAAPKPTASAGSSVATPAPPTPVPTIRPVGPTPRVATPPPSQVFATTAPTPTPQPSPTLLPLGITIDQGATGSSPFALNQFRIAFAGDTRLTPDLPSKRTYKAILLMGLDAAHGTAAFPPGVYATQSTTANWTMSPTSKILHTNLSPEPSGDLIHFLVNNASTSTSNDVGQVTIEVSTASLGTLVTFEATVSAATNSTFPDNGPATVNLPLLASNEGRLNFDIQSVGDRFGRPARIRP